MSGRLAGKIAVVAGAGSGIGKATARMFAAEGARVVCVGRRPEPLEAIVAEISGAGGVAIRLPADLTQEADAEKLAAKVLDETGAPDVVFAGTGIAGPGTAESTSLEEWHTVLATNLTAKWLTFRNFLPSMRERGSGSIIVVSSVGAMKGIPNSFAYAAAKGGCVSMVRQAAADYAQHGVRVNGIAPGTMPTPLVRDAFRGGAGLAGGAGEEEGLARAAQRYPLGRLGEPDEVAYLATYLASGEAQWMTGQTIMLDGGLTAI